jgi:hypothetical protein
LRLATNGSAGGSEVIAGPVIADAIRERLEHAAIVIHITGYRGVKARKLVSGKRRRKRPPSRRSTTNAVTYGDRSSLSPSPGERLFFAPGRAANTCAIGHVPMHGVRRSWLTSPVESSSARLAPEARAVIASSRCEG